MRLTPDTTVEDALAAMAQAGCDEAPVDQCGRPVGVITAAALLQQDDPCARVGDVLEWECVHIRPTADTRWTLRAYRRAAWASLRRRHRATRKGQTTQTAQKGAAR